VKASAVNAWQWAEEGKVSRIQLHVLSYKAFERGKSKCKEVQSRLDKLSAKLETETLPPTVRSISTLLTQSSSSLE